jgi:hypothetical protein
MKLPSWPARGAKRIWLHQSQGIKETQAKINIEQISKFDRILSLGPLAQLVEQLTLNQRVDSSRLSRPTSLFNNLRYPAEILKFPGAIMVLCLNEDERE